MFKTVTQLTMERVDKWWKEEGGREETQEALEQLNAGKVLVLTDWEINRVRHGRYNYYIFKVGEDRFQKWHDSPFLKKGFEPVISTKELILDLCFDHWERTISKAEERALRFEDLLWDFKELRPLLDQLWAGENVAECVEKGIEELQKRNCAENLNEFTTEIVKHFLKK